MAEALVATIEGEPVAFALFYPTYSTTLGRPGLHWRTFTSGRSIAAGGWVERCWPTSRS